MCLTLEVVALLGLVPAMIPPNREVIGLRFAFAGVCAREPKSRPAPSENGSHFDGSFPRPVAALRLAGSPARPGPMAVVFRGGRRKNEGVPNPDRVPIQKILCGSHPREILSGSPIGIRADPWRRLGAQIGMSWRIAAGRAFGAVGDRVSELRSPDFNWQVTWIRRLDSSALLLRVRVSRSRKHRNRLRCRMLRIHQNPNEVWNYAARSSGWIYLREY